MSYDESEDPAYNPFAEDSLESNLTDALSSSSGVTKLSKPQLALSQSAQNSVKGITGERRKRNHSVPEISIIPHSSSLHPLKSGLATQNDADLGVTRPHLSRIINESTLINVKSSEQEDNNASTVKPSFASVEETEVIVHQASLIKLLTAFLFIDLNITGYAKRFIGWCITEIRNLSGKPSKSKPPVGN